MSRKLGPGMAITCLHLLYAWSPPCALQSRWPDAYSKVTMTLVLGTRKHEHWLVIWDFNLPHGVLVGGWKTGEGGWCAAGGPHDAVS